ncbi:MAG: cph1 4 [Ferruginibacter sp.]|uniref:PAS domain S-box protein n=1 Tax=Ferruginibacter sp. TaxID=1940288 RepID=UPI00265964F5|nr:PAS domain S-box protein [Ferruginibacter sp.]MDB5278443.1 cph1 4 [Ferruginibacter sp.]
MRKKLSSGILLIVSIGLLLIIIGIVIIASINGSNKLKDTTQMVSHTQDILIQSGNLLTLMLDNETGARGYTATGQKAFLEPLTLSKQKLPAELEKLKTLVRGNSIQLARTDTLTAYIHERLAFSDRMIAMYDSKGMNAALALIGSGRGKELMDKVRLFVAKIQSTENELLEQRRQKNERQMVQLNRILLLVIIFVLLLLVFFIRKVSIDLVEKKQAADKLANLNRELEQRVLERTNDLLTEKNSMEEILQRIDDGFISLDNNWRYTYINKVAGELINHEPISLIGKNVWEVFPGAIGSATWNLFHQVMAEKKYLYNQDYYAPLDLWQENHVYPSANGISVFIRDITERKRKERELEESHQRFEFVTKATSDTIWDWNITADTMYWGAGMQKLFGYEAQELINGNFWSSRLHAEDRDRVLKHLAEAIDGRADKWIDEYRFLKADNSYAYVADRGFVIRDESGKATRMVGAMQDITKRKKEENRLKLLELFIDSASDAVLITEAEPFDEPGPRIVYVNTAFTQMTGYTAEEVIGKSPRILQGPRSDKTQLKKLSDAIRNWQPCEITTINYKKNGDTFWINFSLKPVADETGWFTHWIAIERDVTAIKNEELQKQLSAEVSQAFLERALLKEKLDKVLNKIVEFGPFVMAEIWLADPEKIAINLAACFSQTSEAVLFYEANGGIKTFLKGEGLPGVTWMQGTPQHWKNPATHGQFTRSEAAAKAGLQSVHAFPLTHKNEVIGVLLIGVGKENLWDNQFTQLFEKIGPHLGSEIKRKQLEEELNQVFNFAPDIICIGNKEGYFTKINRAASELLGYTQQELLTIPFIQLVYPADRDGTISATSKLINGNTTLQFENRFITKAGKIKWLSWSSTPSPDGHVFAVAKDITDKKSLEENLERANTLARIGSWEVDMASNTVFFSKITRVIHEVDDDFIPTMENGINFYKAGFNREKITSVIQQAIEQGISWDEELQIITAKGNERWIRGIGQAEMSNGRCVFLFGTFQDIDARKKAELAVMNVLAEKASILESIDDAFFTLDKNWLITFWNKTAEKKLNKPVCDVIGRNIWEVFPEAINTPAYMYYHLAVSENRVQRFETFVEGSAVWYEVIAYPAPNGLSVYFKNITERKQHEIQLNRLNESLQKQTSELAVSNKELEQYAYVASHDLQEPLRMVTSFLTKLELKYSDALDGKARQYIGFAVNGAKRMRQIILDLLDFSLVGKGNEDWEETDLNVLMDEIISLQQEAIQEKKARIKKGNLPVLKIQKTPLRQVFQNLISNGLKYQREGNTPEITIGSKDAGTHWQFMVADNGIGIEKAYFDKIFIIFQRLHNKDEYSGTGIGLAVTKKIIEKMGGQIWVESAEGKGSTFYFTLPKT